MFKEYHKNVIPLQVKCPNNHDWLVTLNNLNKKGVHCPKCKGIVIHHTKEFVENILNKEGYILLSETYINSGTPLDVRCANEHDWQIRFVDFYNTWYRCPG